MDKEQAFNNSSNPIVYLNREKARKSSLLRLFCLILGSIEILSTFTSIGIPLLSGRTPQIISLLADSLSLLTLISYLLVGKGFYKLPAWLLISHFTLVITIFYVQFGTELPLFYAFLLCIGFAVILLDTWEILLITSYCVLFTVGLYLSQNIFNIYSPFILPTDIAKTIVGLLCVGIAMPVFVILLTIPPRSQTRILVDQNHGLQMALREIEAYALERKLAEEALRKSDERYKIVAQVTNNAVWDRNIITNEVEWNEAIEYISGYSAANIGKTFDWWFEHLHPDDKEKIRSKGEGALESNDQTSMVEYRFRRMDGSYAYILDHSFIIRNEIGQPVRAIGAMMDVSELKMAEEDMRKALKREKELSEMKSRFISTTSHEFRTPLTSILSSAELLQFYGDKWPKEKKEEIFERIYTSVRNLTRLLEDILLVGKAEADKLEFQPEVINLTLFCHTLMEELQLGVSKKHKLQFICPSQEISGRFDQKIIRQIIINLVSNSLKYSPQGGTVQVQLAYQEGGVLIKVKDEGIGIPQEDMEHLFENFHRARNVGVIAGTGLGLAIVKNGVELHQGQVTVSSDVGTGTTFIVSIPLT